MKRAFDAPKSMVPQDYFVRIHMRRFHPGVVTQWRYGRPSFQRTLKHLLEEPTQGAPKPFPAVALAKTPLTTG